VNIHSLGSLLIWPLGLSNTHVARLGDARERLTDPRNTVSNFSKKPDLAENIGWLEGFDLATDRNCRIILVNLENAGGGV